MVSRMRIWMAFAVLSIVPIGGDGSVVAAEESLSDLAFPPVMAKKANPKTWGRDPFESTLRPSTPVSQAAEEKRETARLGSLSLTAVITRQGEGVAVINHEIVRIGDQIAGMKIVEIGKDRVVLQDSSGPVELRLSPFTVDESDESEASE